MNLKTVQNISYAQAVKQVQATNGNLRESIITQSKDTCSHKCLEDGNLLVVNKINFVAFIAEVINCSAQTDKRTEKLKIIISAPARHLGITEVSVEQIQTILGQTEGTVGKDDPLGSQRSKSKI